LTVKKKKDYYIIAGTKDNQGGDITDKTLATIGGTAYSEDYIGSKSYRSFPIITTKIRYNLNIPIFQIKADIP
jgi:hypothetical protein